MPCTSGGVATTTPMPCQPPPVGWCGTKKPPATLPTANWPGPISRKPHGCLPTAGTACCATVNGSGAGIRRKSRRPWRRGSSRPWARWTISSWTPSSARPRAEEGVQDEIVHLAQGLEDPRRQGRRLLRRMPAPLPFTVAQHAVPAVGKQPCGFRLLGSGQLAVGKVAGGFFVPHQSTGGGWQGIGVVVATPPDVHGIRVGVEEGRRSPDGGVGALVANHGRILANGHDMRGSVGAPRLLAPKGHPRSLIA